MSFEKVNKEVAVARAYSKVAVLLAKNNCPSEAYTNWRMAKAHIADARRAKRNAEWSSRR